MKCPRCGYPSTVRETRRADEGYAIRRVRVCSYGHVFGTWELIEAGTRKLPSPATHRKHLYIMSPSTLAGLRQRAASWERHVTWFELAHRGMTHRAIAAQFGVTQPSVSRGITAVQRALAGS